MSKSATTKKPDGSYEISNGDHVVVVVAVRSRMMKGRLMINQACAYCKTCGWDTPTLFSIMAVDAVARRHLGLVTSAEAPTQEIGNA